MIFPKNEVGSKYVFAMISRLVIKRKRILKKNKTKHGA